jgi:hypothetical protein
MSDDEKQARPPWWKAIAITFVMCSVVYVFGTIAFDACKRTTSPWGETLCGIFVTSGR